LRAYIAGEPQRADELIEQAYAAEQSDNARIILACIRQQWRAEAGFGQPVKELEALGAKHPQSPFPLVVLANVYSARAEHGRAASLLLRAAPLAENAESALEYKLRAAEQLTKGRSFDQAEAELKELLSDSEASADQARISRELGHLEQARGRKSRMFEWYERSLELNPADHELRFKAAYEYSEDENETMALFHLKQIEQVANNQGVLNNLGIAYGSLRMPARSVNAYRRSWEKGSSMALGNMANLLVSQGFLEEASNLLAQGEAMDKPDKRVAEVRSRIGSIPGNEAETEKAKLEEAAQERRHRLATLSGRMDEAPKLSGRWESTLGVLELLQREQMVLGREVGALPRTLIGGLEGRVLQFNWSRGKKGDSLYEEGEAEMLIDRSSTSGQGFYSCTKGFPKFRRSPFNATKISDELTESPLLELLPSSQDQP
jgi:tetratricopeptide (TPR) repeat protein